LERGGGGQAPARRNAAATRERLLGAARAEFAERGLGGARVGRIAEAARSNVRLLYHFFGDKLGLYRAALADLWSGITRVLESVEPVPGSGPVEAVRAFFNFLAGDASSARLLLQEALSGAQHLGWLFRKEPRRLERVRAAIRRIYAVGVARGNLRDDVDPEAVSAAMAGMAGLAVACGDAVGVFLPGGALSPVEWRELIADIAARGLAAEGAPARRHR
jgi:AcrR family transcriptional regulator